MKTTDDFGTYTYDEKGAGIYRCPVTGDFDGPADGPETITSPSGHDAKRVGVRLNLVDFEPAEDFEKVKAGRIAAAKAKGKSHPLEDSDHELNAFAKAKAKKSK